MKVEIWKLLIKKKVEETKIEGKKFQNGVNLGGNWF